MKIIEDFETAVRDHEMVGARHPSEHAYIVDRYRITKLKLIQKLHELRKTNDKLREAMTKRNEELGFK